MLFGIAYRIINTKNGKTYIGITKKGLDQRWKAHLCTMRGTCSYPLYKALRKYGTDVFAIECVASAKTENDLFELEKVLIKQENSMSPHGYNLTCGGRGMSFLAEESRVKMLGPRQKYKHYKYNMSREEYLQSNRSLFEELRLSGASCNSIAQTLNQRGVYTVTQKLWTGTVLEQALREIGIKFKPGLRRKERGWPKRLHVLFSSMASVGNMMLQNECAYLAVREFSSKHLIPISIKDHIQVY